MQECLWARGIIPYDLLERPGDHWYDGVVFELGISVKLSVPRATASVMELALPAVTPLISRR